MSENTRRHFLRNASLGAAAVGVAAAVPSMTGSASAATPAEAAHPLDNGAVHDGSFTVWVKDAKAGELAVLVGESEIFYKDRAMAKRLARLAARAQKS